ncbi:MAG: hypothetical protein AAFX76_08950 [Planctomycetota bacterium]
MQTSSSTTSARWQPSRSRRGWAVGSALAGLLLVSAWPMAVGLAERPATAREATAVGVAWATWQRAVEAGEMESAALSERARLERVVPFDGEALVLDEAPGLAWGQAAAIGWWGPGDAGSGLLGARRLGVVMALVSVAAVFWAGWSLGGLRAAGFAGLICVGNPLLVWYGRVATAEAVTAGWIMLSIAAGLWALRPMRPTPKLWRLGTGWGLSGAALGLGALTGGPWALVSGVGPLLAVGLLCPRRLTHGLGLTAAVAIAGLLTIPWAVYVWENDPEAWAARSLWGIGDGGLWERAMGLALGLGVWVPAALVAVVSPWWRGWDEGRGGAHSGAHSGGRLWLGWAWAVTAGGLAVLGPGGWGAALPGVLAVAALTGQVLGEVSERASHYQPSAIWRWAGWPTAGLVLGASLIGPVRLVRHLEPTAAPTTAYWVGTAVVLTLLAGLATRWVGRLSPARSAVSWAAWSAVAAALVLVPFNREEAGPVSTQRDGVRPATPDVLGPTKPGRQGLQSNDG